MAHVLRNRMKHENGCPILAQQGWESTKPSPPDFHCKELAPKRAYLNQAWSRQTNLAKLFKLFHVEQFRSPSSYRRPRAAPKMFHVEHFARPQTKQPGIAGPLSDLPTLYLAAA